MEITLCPIDRTLLSAFLPYLMPDAIRALETDVPGWLFFGVKDDAHSYGAATAVLKAGSLQLTSLYVDHKVRRQGLGSRLLAALVHAAGPVQQLLANWVLPQLSFGQLTAFLSARGFVCSKPFEPIYRLDTADLHQTPPLRSACAPNYRPDPNVVPFELWTDEERDELRSDPTIPSALRPDFLEESLLLPLCLGYRCDGRIVSYALLRASGPQEVTFMAALSRSGALPAAFLLTVTAVFSAGLRHFGGDFICWLDADTEEVRALADRLSGGKLEPWWSGNAACALAQYRKFTPDA